MPRILLALLISLTFITASAQDAEPTAFMRAMALVPISAAYANSGFVSYADYHSGITARGFEIPENWAAFESGKTTFPVLVLPLGGPGELLSSLMVGGPEYETLLGFDFFDIAQAVEYGMPPPRGQILIGDVDPESVTSAYSARGYTADTGDTGTLLCPESGCDRGFTIDLANRNPANPFGGNLGRNEFAFVADGLFLNSPDPVTLQSAVEAFGNPQNSLAALPEVQTVGRILAGYPFVNAVMLVDPLQLSLADPAALLAPGVPPDQLEAFLSGFSGEPLAPYALAALAATADDAGEYGLVLLTYDNADDAEAAADVIDTRLATMISMATNQPFSEVYGAVGTLEPAQVVHDETTGLSTVVVRLAGEPLSRENTDETSIQSDRQYLRFVRGLMNRDLNWLVWGGAEQG